MGGRALVISAHSKWSQEDQESPSNTQQVPRQPGLRETLSQKKKKSFLNVITKQSFACLLLEVTLGIGSDLHFLQKSIHFVQSISPLTNSKEQH